MSRMCSMGWEDKNGNKILARKPERKRLLRRVRHR
jgi:hypothetical protein